MLQGNAKTKDFVGIVISKPWVRYVLVGGTTYIFDIGVLAGLYYGLNTSRTVAASASFWLGLLFSFVLQKLLAFQDYQSGIRAVSRQAFWYSVLVLVNYVVTVAIVNLFPGQFIIISRTLALIITTIWNYTIYKLIFNQAKRENDMKNKLTRFQRACQLFCRQNRSKLALLAVILSSLLLLAVSIYAGIQGARVLSSTSDSFVSTYMASDWQPGGTVNLVTQHTALLKFPLLWLQGKIDYNFVNYVFVDVLLVAVTVFAWSYLIYRVFGKSKRGFVMSNLMLSGILLSSTATVTSLASTTNRNIEYPIALIYLILLMGLIKSWSKLRWIIAAIILALLVASDFLFLYSLVPALLLVALWLWWANKIDPRKAFYLLSNIIIGTVTGYGCLKVLGALNVLNLTGRHGGSFLLFKNLPTDIYNAFGDTLRLFGGFFLGSPIKVSYGGEILSFIFVIVCFIAAYQIIRHHNRSREKTKTPPKDFIPIAMIIWALALYAFYILLGQATNDHDANSRYLSVLPFLAVFILIARSRYWRNSSKVILVAFILVGGLMNSFHGWFSYKDAAYTANQQINLDKEITNYARRNNIQLVLGSYSYGPALRFYSHNHPEAHPIIKCNDTFYYFSYNNWYKPQKNVKRSAIVIDDYLLQTSQQTADSSNTCPQNLLEKDYGKSAQKSLVGQDHGKPVYMFTFNYDVRSKLIHKVVWNSL